jgi:hypothetical protein
MPGQVMKFNEPNKNGRIYQEPGVYAPYIPVFKTSTISSYEKEFRFCKLSYPIMKSDLKLCKKIVTDNTLKTAILNLRHDNDKIRNLCKAKIENGKISKYYYIKWTGRKLKAKFSLEAAKDIKMHFSDNIEKLMIEELTKQIADEIDRELIGKLKTWSTTIDKENTI